MNIQGIIFDFDGTLFDSMGIWETIGSDYLLSLGIEPEPDLHEKIKTLSLRQSAEYAKENYPISLTVEEIMEGVNHMVEDFYFYHAQPKAHVIAMLDEFQNRGIKMCIATATDHYQIEAALKRCEMEQYFEHIFTCTEVGHGKDEPHIYEAALDLMGTDKRETLVFEDAFHAAETAKKAGFFVVGVYDCSEKKTEELKKLADLYVENFEHIKNI